MFEFSFRSLSLASVRTLFTHLENHCQIH